MLDPSSSPSSKIQSSTINLPFAYHETAWCSPFSSPFRASTIHLGFAPLPAQVSPDGLRYVEPHHELIHCSK